MMVIASQGGCTEHLIDHGTRIGRGLDCEFSPFDYQDEARCAIQVYWAQAWSRSADDYKSSLHPSC
jgi:hypothetical protein